MTKVVVKKLEDKNAGRIRTKRTSVKTKRVRDDNGALISVRTVDGSSKTLSSDLTLVFGRNVQRARKENKRLLGVADIVPGN